MKKHVFPFIKPALLALALAAPAGVSALEVVEGAESNTCAICHGDVQGGFEASVHAQFKVVCSDCHGGDPKKIEWEEAMSEKAGFKGRFQGTEVLELCDKCHGDYARMRQYGIPIDQLAQYRTSRHGEALLLKGDIRVAVCTSCHGVHDIMPVKDPRSTVYSLNIPGTCGKCHSDEKLMASYGIGGEIVKHYSEGVHGKALLQEKNTGMPNCATCHGNHGAAPPGMAEVVNVCGNCHVNTRKYFQMSAHYEKGKMECINCHDNHRNLHPDEAMYTDVETGCRKCHDDGNSKENKFIERVMVKNLSNATLAIDEAEADIEKAVGAGLYVEEEGSLLREAKAGMTKFGPVQHSMSEKEIDAVLRVSVSQAELVSDTVAEKFKGLYGRKVFSLALAGFFLFFLFIVYLKYSILKNKFMKEKQGTAQE